MSGSFDMFPDAAIEFLLTRRKQHTISPADLREGQKVTGITRWRDNGDPYVDPFKRPITVKTVEPCAGANRRTHTHFNGGCWDNRIPVAVG